MRTHHLTTSLGFGLLLAASTANAQTPPAAPVVTPRPDDAPPAPRVADPARDAAEAAATERLLAGLDADARERRVLALSLGVGGGAVMAGLGTWLLVREDSSADSLSNPGIYLAGVGAGLVLGGGLIALAPSYEQKLREAWEETRGYTVAARRARFGAALDEYARTARAGRRLGGWMALGVGAVGVAGAVVLTATRSPSERGFIGTTDVMGAVGGFATLWGILMLTQPSPVEYAQRFWNAGEARPVMRLMGASVLPTRGGALAGVTLVF